MISVSWNSWHDDVAALMKAYEGLPKHIAKKHILAAMKRAIRDSRGVQTLKAMTPKGGTRLVRGSIKRDARGSFAAGSQAMTKQKGGALRRAVVVNARYIGRNSDGVAVAVLGYRWGTESRKAIWLEFGTRRMRARHMAARAMDAIKGPVRTQLCAALAAALEAGARENASKRNPGAPAAARR
jgi:HK97 gp10 family phage protein